MQLQKRRIKKAEDLPKSLIGVTVSIGQYMYKVVPDTEWDLPQPVHAFAIAKETLDRVSDVVEEVQQPAPAPRTTKPTKPS